jgi:hypothetical protein
MRTTLNTLLLLLLAVSTSAQTPKTGNATAAGTCNLANSGSNVTHIHIDCGIGQQQGKKIIELLNRALGNKDIAIINTKLDELIQVASRPATSNTLNCTGSNCVQGNNYGSQVLNQFGAPKLIMTDAQRDAIRDELRPYAGRKFDFSSDGATPDSQKYADQLFKALTDAGLTPGMVMISMTVGRTFQGGVSIDSTKDQMDLANALANAMAHARLLSNPIPLLNLPDSAQGIIRITIAPNH